MDANAYDDKQFIAYVNLEDPVGLQEMIGTVWHGLQGIRFKDTRGQAWAQVQGLARHPTLPNALYFMADCAYQLGQLRATLRLGCVVQDLGWHQEAFFGQGAYVAGLTLNFKDSNKWLPPNAEEFVALALRTADHTLYTAYGLDPQKLWTLQKGRWIGGVAY